MTQVNSISSAAKDSFGIPEIVTGIAAAAVAFIIISGGIKRIGKASQFLIPILSVVYIGAAILIIIKFRNNLSDTFSLIFKEEYKHRTKKRSFFQRSRIGQFCVVTFCVGKYQSSKTGYVGGI